MGVTSIKVYKQQIGEASLPKWKCLWDSTIWVLDFPIVALSTAGWYADYQPLWIYEEKAFETVLCICKK